MREPCRLRGSTVPTPCPDICFNSADSKCSSVRPGHEAGCKDTRGSFLSSVLCFTSPPSHDVWRDAPVPARFLWSVLGPSEAANWPLDGPFILRCELQPTSGLALCWARMGPCFTWTSDHQLLEEGVLQIPCA
jgi:hypothetical protein